MPTLIGTLALVGLLGGCAIRIFRNAHKKADVALSEIISEANCIFDNTLDGILILDDTTHCLDGNPAAMDILHTSRDRLVGRTFSRFFSDPDVFREEWQALFRHELHRGRIGLLADDGAKICVDFAARTNYLPGRHILILCDVTDRARTEENLRRSEERFEQIAKDVPEIIWTAEATTQKLTYINSAFVSVTGHPIKSLYDDPTFYRELIHRDDRVRVLTKFAELSRSGIFDEEFRFLHANGTVRWVSVKAHTVSEKGVARWFAGTAQDITDRKDAERRIAEHLDAAETARAEAEALRKASLALSRNLPMDSMLDALFECISSLVPFHTAVVLLREGESELMLAREAPGGQSKRTGLVIKASESEHLQKILFEQKPVLIPNTAEPKWRPILPFERAHSWLGIPLVMAGRVLGVLSLSSRKANAFTLEHLRLARSLGVSAAVAIENARVRERAEICAASLEVRLRDLL